MTVQNLFVQCLGYQCLGYIEDLIFERELHNFSETQLMTVGTCITDSLSDKHVRNVHTHSRVWITCDLDQ